MKKFLFTIVAIVAGVLIWRSCTSSSSSSSSSRSGASGAKVRLATTTSVVDSGLLDALVAAYPAGVEVHAVGSGAALRMVDGGKADVAVVHNVPRGLAFMHNDFVIVGPAEGAAAIAGAGDVREVMRAIARSGRPFVSRGDDSGTHRAERKLWAAAGVEPGKLVETKTGMKATLARASAEGGYALSDRATFIAHRKGLKLAILFQGDDELANTYTVVGDHAFARFVASDEARKIIGAHGVAAHGEPLFTPVE